jgi:hypothetical protein
MPEKPQIVGQSGTLTRDVRKYGKVFPRGTLVRVACESSSAIGLYDLIGIHPSGDWIRDSADPQRAAIYLGRMPLNAVELNPED